jgi:type II restriction enzyme
MVGLPPLRRFSLRLWSNAAMQLSMDSALAAAYKSGTQRARVVTELWAEQNLYCAACTSDSLQRLPHNAKSLDFRCVVCNSSYQLKAGQHRFSRSVPDGAYETMKQTILSGSTPNLLLLHYDLADWSVRNLILVPSFAFSLSALQCRRALAQTAQRAGWIGCNILLTNIPPDARIPAVLDGRPEKPTKVRERFEMLRPIAKLSANQKGWTLDVLNVVRSLGKQTFSLRDVLAHGDRLAQLHPDNRHINEKVRQQLQVLRDLGLLEFVDNRGTYRLTPLT